MKPWICWRKWHFSVCVSLSRNLNGLFLIRVMEVFIEWIRNKMREAYAKVLAGCKQKAEPSQPAVLWGALPAGEIPMSSWVDLIFTIISPPCCWDSTNSLGAESLERGGWSTGTKPRGTFLHLFWWSKHIFWKPSSRLWKPMMQTPKTEVIEVSIQKGTCHVLCLRVCRTAFSITLCLQRSKYFIYFSGPVSEFAFHT